ncbi:phosphopantetheine-binding protein [Streptomyces sp. NPDC020403]|uniref:acyl carrier protein n=1 Tax=unclassified Streptomyces TaxID=2593676 RepID=UPI0033CAC072
MSNADRISEYIVREFLPDLTPSQLPHDQDLLGDGAIDSLGVLKLIAWVEHHFELAVGDTDLDPENFRSVEAIDAYVARSQSAPVTGG